MSKRRLTGKRAVWFGLLGTPVLLVAAIMLVGVTAGSAGPSSASTTAGQATAAAADDIVSTPNLTQRTSAEVLAYWTPERMASATPYPMASNATPTTAAGSVATIPQASGTAGVAMMKANGSVDTQAVPQQGTGALTEPYHNDIPYTQWQWFGRYLRNVPNGSPNLAISAVHKMFFSQDADANGVAENYVCSSSTIGVDAVWTAGHCVNNGLVGTAGVNQGWSFNTLFCPSYNATNGINPSAGCWSDDPGLLSFTGWTEGNLNFDYDFGGADDPGTGTIPANGTIGNFTGWLGLGWNWGNVNWVALGYPHAAPFDGQTIEVCASSLGYSDSGGSTTPDSVAIGCDMTGGSSGGPWILSFGRFGGQPGGAAGLWLNGHNDWRHTAEPNEMNSPYYDCRAVILFNALNEAAVACP